MTLGEEKARELEQALDSVENALEWYDDAEAFAEFYDFRRKLCMNLGRPSAIPADMRVEREG